MPKDFPIGIVGNCASGKTTLMQGLKGLGYQAINIPQEHSVAPRFWRKLNVEFLVVLSCTLQTAKRRRSIAWRQERLDAQAEKLADARAHCQQYLPTGDLDIDQVLKVVTFAVEQSRKERVHAGEDYASGSETPPQG